MAFARGPLIVTLGRVVSIEIVGTVTDAVSPIELVTVSTEPWCWPFVESAIGVGQVTMSVVPDGVVHVN